MPELNEPLLRSVVDRIISDPASLDMRTWGMKTECGTTYCVAGHTVAEAGLELIFDSVKGLIDVNMDGNIRNVPAAAQKLLGLDVDQADQIFYGMIYCDMCKKVINSSGWCYNCNEYARAASPREIIMNISKVTGLEFKIPDDLL